MSQGSRPSRVADQLRADIMDLLAREVHDPGIGFLTVTYVKVTSDLQIARVYYTTLGDEKARRESQRALRRVTPFLRRHIGRRLRLKRVPELEFFFDEAVERGDRIEQILQEISHGGGSAGPDRHTDGLAHDTPVTARQNEQDDDRHRNN